MGRRIFFGKLGEVRDDSRRSDSSGVDTEVAAWLRVLVRLVRVLFVVTDVVISWRMAAGSKLDFRDSTDCRLRG